MRFWFATLQSWQSIEREGGCRFELRLGHCTPRGLSSRIDGSLLVCYIDYTGKHGRPYLSSSSAIFDSEVLVAGVFSADDISL